MCIVGLVNYGNSGNIYSVSNAIKAVGGKVLIIDEIEDFNKVDKLILPGVGSFSDAINELKKKSFLDKLKNTKKPILGICLGMQILLKQGFEYGDTQGLGLIEGKVKKMETNDILPHIGFNSIEVVKDNELLKGLDGKKFYFMHSYEVIDCTNVASLTKYNKYQFISSIKKNNIYGVQFHPEKSKDAGLELFKNFIH